MIATLSTEEMITTGTVGLRRWIAVLHNEMQGPYTANDFSEGLHRYTISAMAEFVVAREFNLFWQDGVGSYAAGDVGGIIEVRCRTIPGSGLDIGFKVTDTVDGDGQPKNKPFVLVHAHLACSKKETLKFDMVGWIYAQDGWAAGKANGTLKGVNFVQPALPPLRKMSELHSILGY